LAALTSDRPAAAGRRCATACAAAALAVAALAVAALAVAALAVAALAVDRLLSGPAIPGRGPVLADSRPGGSFCYP